MPDTDVILDARRARAQLAILQSIASLLEKQDGATSIVVSVEGHQIAHFELPASRLALDDPCQEAIHAVLRDAAKRLTTDQIIAAMEKRHQDTGCRVFSDSWVKEKLSEMIDSGAVDNDQKSKPKGYGLL